MKPYTLEAEMQYRREMATKPVWPALVPVAVLLIGMLAVTLF